MISVVCCDVHFWICRSDFWRIRANLMTWLPGIIVKRKHGRWLIFTRVGLGLRSVFGAVGNRFSSTPSLGINSRYFFVDTLFKRVRGDVGVFLKSSSPLPEFTSQRPRAWSTIFTAIQVEKFWSVCFRSPSLLRGFWCEASGTRSHLRF